MFESKSLSYFPQSEYKRSFKLHSNHRKTRPIRLNDSLSFGSSSSSQKKHNKKENNESQSSSEIKIFNNISTNSLNFYFDDNNGQQTTKNIGTMNDLISSDYKKGFLRAFDEQNRGFDDDYARNKGGTLVKFADRSLPPTKPAPTTSYSIPEMSIRTGKRMSNRNMFVSHIDSHIFPEKKSGSSSNRFDENNNSSEIDYRLDLANGQSLSLGNFTPYNSSLNLNTNRNYSKKAVVSV
jgi:hypothetical protein